MVRYHGEDENFGTEEPPDELPGSYHGPPILPQLIWTLLALAVLVALSLLTHRAN